MEVDGGRRLHHFNWHCGNARGKRAGRQPRLVSSGTDPSGVGEHGSDEWLAIGVLSADLHGPYRAGAFGHGLLGLDLRQRLEEGIG